MTGLYIHIPFCVSKCAYCDFLSFAGETKSTMRLYTDALVREIRSIGEKDLTFDTVYIGGGTPTALPLPFLLEVIEAVNGLNVIPDAEFTVEANPGTCNEPGFFPSLKQAGVNRLSFGLQAWQDALLKSLGRIHTREEFTANYSAALSAGVTNISVDVMFALSGQTMAMWAETLAGVTALRPRHISAYSLTPEEGTPLRGQIERGEAALPGDETDREMYHYAREFLSAAGYTHYELSNFAVPGYESKHNTRYWKRRPYMGAGLGAHSFGGNARWHNTTDLQSYISLTAREPEDFEVISEREALSEEMFLGLRLMEGVPENSFYENEINRLAERGLLKRESGRVSLTRLGMDLANQVFMAF